MTGHIIPFCALLPRGSAGALPAVDAARPVPPTPGRAAHDFDRHPACPDCGRRGCDCPARFGRDYGTMGADWIADQIRRADGDTRPVARFDADAYRAAADTLAPNADLRDGDLMPREPMGWPGAIMWGVMIGLSITFWAYVGGPALFAAFDWLAGWL